MMSTTDRHIQGQDRFQLSFQCLDDQIAPDSEVRILEAFVQSLNLQALGFDKTETAHTGRKPFHPAALLKLYLYGYMNGIRSSRKLARECQRNLEVMWLLEGLRPSYKTIADFRKDHSEALRQTFRQLVALARGWDLIAGRCVALDSTKIRAVNAKKNNYNQKRIERQIAYIDNKLKEYLQQLEQADEAEDGSRTSQLLDKISTQLQRRKDYELLEEQLASSGDTQISTTDPDARALPQHQNIVEVGYAVQSVVDEQEKLVVHYDVDNQRDDHALAENALAAKAELQAEELDVLADAGYHTGSELSACEVGGVRPWVAPKQGYAQVQPGYQSKDFVYLPDGDVYLCPQGYELTSNGSWYTKRGYRAKHYKTRACKHCPVRDQCTRSKTGRLIERSEHQDAIDRNRARIDNYREYYRKRQQIVEHPFGTIKRHWHITHTLLKGKAKVRGEMGLVFLAYNLRRIINLIGPERLLRALQARFLALLEGIMAILGQIQDGIGPINSISIAKSMSVGQAK